MGNGKNEPVEFTRGDAERLRVIELKQHQVHTKMGSLVLKIEQHLAKHDEVHISVDRRVAKNSQYRRTTTRIFVWVVSTGGGLGLLATGARAMGWLN
jgi:hypothetical protein